MRIDFSRLCKNLRKAFTGTNRTPFKFTLKRLAVLCWFFLLFPWLMFFTWTCFMLDGIFFPDYKKVDVTSPVFVIGNFRSGSTFLQRILAMDRQTFTYAKTWEIYLAPSITQRKFFRALFMFDRWIGNPVHNFLDSFEKRNLDTVPMHKVGLREPEEDEGFLFFIWSTFFIWFFFPETGPSDSLLYFDTTVPYPKRKRIINFYRECVQRYLYLNKNKVFLSKNPSFSPKISTLLDVFPDARIIYLARDPAEMLISEVGWFTYAWNFLHSPRVPYPFLAEIIKLTLHWYTYPPAVLAKKAPGNHLVITFNDLIRDTEKSIELIYERFGLTIHDQFRKKIQQAVLQSGKHSPSHKRTLEDIGLDRKKIAVIYKDVYDYYGFDTARKKDIL